MAIMAGIGTVLADDPLLTARIEGLRSPVRIIADSSLRIPIDSKIVQTAGDYKTIVACAVNNEEKIAELEKHNVEVMLLPGEDGRVDLKKLMQILGGRKIDSVLVEGGGTLNDSMLTAGLVKRLEVFIGPKVFGGKDSKSPIGGLGISEVSDAVKFSLLSSELIDEDILLTYERK